ncbi:hypothetical protein Bca4012_056259 [Brassica carinata]|uniref:Cryptochrome C-terminal domain-containing protein n=1 Tax=Brassica carinata TaxID=52824 RepID=A0A8X7W020_BRACI|nr:hypothetical protein Bca52824_013917 [Brassica carinata]
MWQLETAAIENGSQEELRHSTYFEETHTEFPRNITMEETKPTRLNPIRRYEDQTVPSNITSLIKPDEDEESSLNLRNSVGDNRENVLRNMVHTNQAQQQVRAEPFSIL